MVFRIIYLCEEIPEFVDMGGGGGVRVPGFIEFIITAYQMLDSGVKRLLKGGYR
jgi:hypothetical protein